MKYKIGDVARILGISADLLRYYEKKGVVTPEKNTSNDYRYYSPWDINFLMDCLWFKNFGFGIEQIADIVKIPNINDIDGLFLEKEDELRAHMERCRLLLLRSEEHRRDLLKVEQLLYKCEISDSPELVCHINRVGGEYITGPVMEKLALRWLHAMPLNSRYFEMGGENFKPGAETDYRWGYSLSMDYVRQLNFEISPVMHITKPRKSIHTVFKNLADKGGFSSGALQYALDYAEENALTVKGPVHGVLLASIMENERLTGYFEAWLPVE